MRAEDEKGVWELVDGLQRISTVLEFMGLLKDEDEVLQTPSKLVRAGHKPRIPSLDHVSFADLSLQARLAIKRAGCRVEVIKIGSKPTMKYEVFERLNTGGSELTAQEVRNCIFRATKPDFVEWIEDLAKFKPFSENLLLSELQGSTMFDRGLILRYLTLKNAWQEFEHDVEPFITDYIREVLEEERDFDRHQEDQLFRQTFRLISSAMGEDAWRHVRGGKHKGPLFVYLFETVSVGIALNIDQMRTLKVSDLRKRITKFKQHPTFVHNPGAGANIKSRLRNRMEFACTFFSE